MHAICRKIKYGKKGVYDNPVFFLEEKKDS
jgi:hypothetical protein